MSAAVTVGDALAVHVGRGDPGVEGERRPGSRPWPPRRSRRRRRSDRPRRSRARWPRPAPREAGPVSTIADRMKLVVPLTIPMTRRSGPRQAIRAAAGSAGWRPATAASKYRSTPGGVGRLVQLGAVVGQQRLVGGDHAGAAAQRGQQQRPGRFDAADHLDDDVDVVPGDQPRGVGGEQLGGTSGCAVADGAPRRRPAPAARRPGRPVRRPAGAAAGPPASRRRRSRAARSRTAAVPLRRSSASTTPVDPTSRASRSSSVSRRTSSARTRRRGPPTTAGRGTWL